MKKLSKVVIIILVLVAVILLVFRSGMLGPFIGLNASHSVENEFDCGFILEEANLKLNTPIKLIHKYQSPVTIDGYRALFCLKIEDFPDTLTLEQRSLWKRFNELDSIQLYVLNFALPSRNSAKRINPNLSDSLSAKILEKNVNFLPWFPRIEDLDESFLIGFSSVNWNDGDIKSYRILLYNTKDGFLYYKKN